MLCVQRSQVFLKGSHETFIRTRVQYATLSGNKFNFILTLSPLATVLQKLNPILACTVVYCYSAFLCSRFDKYSFPFPPNKIPHSYIEK